MPRIKFIKLTCGCGSEYRVSIERIADGPFACVSCGATVDVAAYHDVLELVHRYSELVVKLEERMIVEGDTLTPRTKEPAHKIVAW